MPTKKASGAHQWKDSDDAPTLTGDFFREGDVYRGDRLVRRGRPKSAQRKEAVNLRIDPDVLARFRATGRGWQTRINDVLKRAAAGMSAAQRKR